MTLESHDVGHAYPTGDLFRRVRVSAKAVAEELFVVGTDERFLQRSFGDGLGVGHVVLREQVADTRLHPGEATIVDLELGSRAEFAPIEWEVVLERVQHVRDGQNERAEIADSIELAAGSVSP